MKRERITWNNQAEYKLDYFAWGTDFKYHKDMNYYLFNELKERFFANLPFLNGKSTWQILNFFDKEGNRVIIPHLSKDYDPYNGERGSFFISIVGFKPILKKRGSTPGRLKNRLGLEFQVDFDAYEFSGSTQDSIVLPFQEYVEIGKPKKIQFKVSMEAEKELSTREWIRKHNKNAPK